MTAAELKRELRELVMTIDLIHLPAKLDSLIERYEREKTK